MPSRGGPYPSSTPLLLARNPVTELPACRCKGDGLRVHRYCYLCSNDLNATDRTLTRAIGAAVRAGEHSTPVKL